MNSSHPSTELAFIKFLERCKLSPSRGAFIFGPPGCGKTHLIQSMAQECQVKLIRVVGPHVTDIQSAFVEAREWTHSVIFLDDLYSDFYATEKSNTLIDVIKDEIDSIYNQSIYVIGASARPDLIDPSLFCPGRFDRLIYFPPPDLTSRQAIMESHLINVPLEEDVDMFHIAQRTPRYSAADLTEICQRACKIAIREDIEAERNQIEQRDETDEDSPDLSHKSDPPLLVSMRHFEQSLSTARRSISERDIISYEEFRDNLVRSKGLLPGPELFCSLKHKTQHFLFPLS